MILIYNSDFQNEGFYADMGRYFASLEIAKELERQLYNKPNSEWYIECENGTINGFVAVFDNGNHYFIDNLYVLPEYRNNGIASVLVCAAVNDHTDKPIKCIANNPYALKIFSCLGFVEVGQRGKYKKLIKH